jgi:hypothetical protein
MQQTPQSLTCSFRLTRGRRIDQSCGRPVYRSSSSGLCLQHIRMINENPAKYAVSYPALCPAVTEGNPYVSLEINKPLETPRTILPPPPDSMEELIDVKEEILDENDPLWEDTLLQMLNQLRKEAKTQKK